MIRGLGTVSVVQIACGDNYCMALTRGGKLFSWGNNDHGQLGHGPTSGNKTVSVPTPIGRVSTFYNYFFGTHILRQM